MKGGRNILDTYTERQLELEKKLEEIAERKKREVEMQQQLELQEETTLEIRDTLTSVQQEVELKTRKLKKCYSKYLVNSISSNSRNAIFIIECSCFGFAGAGIEAGTGRHARRTQS